jgi:hypothetical protein
MPGIFLVVWAVIDGYGRPSRRDCDRHNATIGGVFGHATPTIQTKYSAEWMLACERSRCGGQPDRLDDHRRVIVLGCLVIVKFSGRALDGAVACRKSAIRGAQWREFFAVR